MPQRPDKNPPLLVRVDASPATGYGHAMRCLALAQAALKGGMEVVFAMENPPAAIAQRLVAEGIRLQQVENSNVDSLSAMAERIGAAWIVLDGYHFDAPFQKTLRAAGFQLLVIDDYACVPAYHADLILNQNTPRSEIYADRAHGTRLLMGASYALLRQEFLQAVRPAFSPAASRVLLTFGGSDPRGLTLKAAAALSKEALEIIALAGPANLDLAALEALAKSSGCLTILHDSSDMAALMGSVDIAVTTASVTSFELAYMGIPQILLMSAENQKFSAEMFAQADACVFLGWHEDIGDSDIRASVRRLDEDQATRRAFRERGQSLVDGRGAGRVLQEMHNLGFRIRDAREDDARLVFEWANERAARAASFQSGEISWADHQRWFAGKIISAQCAFYIVENSAGEALAQVRFDKEENHAVISISLAPAQRGKGYAAVILRRAIAEFRRQCGLPVHAYIRPENFASQKIFTRAGFLPRPKTVMKGCDAAHFILPPCQS